MKDLHKRVKDLSQWERHLNVLGNKEMRNDTKPKRKSAAILVGIAGFRLQQKN